MDPPPSNNRKPTENQTKLYELLADFSQKTVLELVAGAYKTFGRALTAGNALPQIILPIAETYFNTCAQSIYSREDEYINSAFDAMCAIELGCKSHPIDLLQLIVMLSLNCIYNMKIGDVITDVYTTSMEAVKYHLQAVIRRYANLAADLHGCPKDHIHEPIQPGEKIFTFTLDRYVETSQGPVKLTRLEI